MFFTSILIPILLNLSFIALVEFKNPFSSLLSLAAFFILSVLALVSVGAEFLGLTLLIIYLGAVLILFLFIAMTIDLRLKYSYGIEYLSNAQILWYCSISILIGKILTTEDIITIESPSLFFFYDLLGFTELLYTHYGYIFISIGYALLVTMLCTIGLVIKDIERSKYFIKL